jgi:hypothetical protein
VHGSRRRLRGWRPGWSKWSKGLFVLLLGAFLGWAVPRIADWTSEKITGTSRTISEQEAEIVRGAANKSYVLADSRRLDFQGNGATERVIVLRRVMPGFIPETIGDSDDLRVYDVQNHRLRQRLSFHPMKDKSGDSFSFNIQHLVDVGGGREAIIGGVIRNHLGPFLEFPVALYRNPRIGEYRLYPILDGTNRGARPELPKERRGSPLVFGRTQTQLYQLPTTIRNRADSPLFESFGTQRFLLFRGATAWVLLGAFISRYTPRASWISVRGWLVYLTGERPVVSRCDVTSKPVLIRLSLMADPSSALVRARQFYSQC